MVWANFLHIYQPPTQTPKILDRVVNESYRKIFAGLLDNPQARMTLNISAVLTEMLAKHGYADVIQNIVTLLERGQIELTATAKFHPFLPKLPEDQIIRQINLNEETNRSYLGSSYAPTGFFPPEMGYAPQVAPIVKKLGFKWIILDEIACPEPVNYTTIYHDGQGLDFFFRERQPSFKILSAQLGTGPMLLKELSARLGGDEYLLTAMDGETFGHHRPGLEKLLLDIYQSRELPTVTISELPAKVTSRTQISPRASTWATHHKDIDARQPFLRWDDPGNEIHELQWQLTNLAISAVKEHGAVSSQDLLDQSLHSDQYWWASARPWWSLEMIEKGAHEQIEAISSCQNLPENITNQAHDLYIRIITTGFDWQRSGHVEDLSRQEDEEMHAILGQKPKIEPEDLEKLIKLLTEQMQTAAADQEFTRAEEIRKRIQELTEQKTQIHEHKVNE